MEMKTEEEFEPVWGAKAIGKVVGVTERQAFYLLEKKLLPGQKIGNQWVGETGQLKARILGNVETS